MPASIFSFKHLLEMEEDHIPCSMAPNTDITKLLDRFKQMELERDKLLHDLTERVKELQCLYKLGSVIERHEDLELEDVFKDFINHIPPAWQYPEITCARILFQGQEYKTPNFRITTWKQTATIVAGGDTVGTVEVYYLEARPVAGEGPFLKEERTLLDYIAERLGRVIERAWAQEALQVTNEEREIYEKVAKQSLKFTPSIHPLTALKPTPEIHPGQVEKNDLLHDLTERVKELQCLYKLETVIGKHDDLDEILREFVNQLPPAYQHPESTCARIQINDQEYKTLNFQETEWMQAAPIVAGGDAVGGIEIYYLDEENDWPFLKEEQTMLDNVASRLGLLVERTWAQEALQVTSEEREELESIINQGPAVVFLWRNTSGWPIDFVSGNAQQIGLDPKIFYTARTPFMELIHPDDRENVLATVSGHDWEKQAVLVQEYRIITSGGEPCWVEDRRWVRRNELGTVSHFQGILTNITDRKRECLRN
jgi:PAS domain-containing protein